MKFWLVMLVALVLLASITGLTHGLIDPDEGRYAEIPREMIESGDFITPRLNYVKYFEKPALHYWLTAGAFKIFGKNEPAARATPVLLGLGGVLITFVLTKKMFIASGNMRRGLPDGKPDMVLKASGTRAGFFAAAMLSSSVLWYAMSHMNITDMTLTFFFTLAMAAYYFWYTRKKFSWILIFYASMALAVLTKGLVGVVLPGGIALLHRICVTANDASTSDAASGARACVIASPSASESASTSEDTSAGTSADACASEGASASSDTSANANLSAGAGASDGDGDEASAAGANACASKAASLSEIVSTSTSANAGASENASENARASAGASASLSKSANARAGKNVREILKLFSPAGIALFFAITLPWFVLVCRENPDFFNFFFIREHFLRYTTKIHDRWEPFWYFIPVMLGALVPWTGLLLDAFHTARGKWGALRRSDGIFLTLWALVPFVFFSISGSKLVPYILPCLPPVVILMGVSFEIMTGQRSRWGLRRFVVFSTLIFVPLIAAGIFYPRSHTDVPQTLTQPLVASLFVFWIMSFGLFWKRRIIAPVLCLLSLAVPMSCSHAFNYFADLHSQREIAAMIQERIQDGDKVVAWRELMQGLAFYMDRRVITAGTLNELEFGANALLADSVTDSEAELMSVEKTDEKTGGEVERSEWFMDTRSLRRIWNGPNRVFLVSRRKYVNDLAKEVGREPVRLGETLGEILCANF